ncbi:hypothetical protein ACFLSI_03135 [Bacteroidota bacterium]
MRIIFICFVFVFCTAKEGKTQKPDNVDFKRNGVYTELYSIRHDFSEGYFSINYERIIGKKKRTILRAGIYPDFETTVSFPITLSWISSPLKNHHFEYGVGAVYRVELYDGNVYKDLPALIIPLMYRYQNRKALFFRAGVNLFVSWPTLPSPSFSVGYKF